MSLLPNAGQLSRDRAGYGYFSIKAKTVKAHRIAWQVAKGEIPNGLCVLHRCDNPGCVNPGHLWLGTSADNNRDRNAKGRQASGERTKPWTRAKGDRNASRLYPERRPKGDRHWNARLTIQDVRDIHQALDDGVSQKACAARYGVAPQSIGKIVHGIRWRHVSKGKVI